MIKRLAGSMVVPRLMLIVAAAMCLACPSRAEPKAADKADPGTAARDGGAAPAIPGGDVAQMLQTAMKNLEKPGPYEAPLSSPGYADDKPHWGVLALSGDVGELESFSWTSGMTGVEVRALQARLRELAGDANLVGLVLRVDDLAVSLPDALELHAALRAFRDAGKKLICHTEGAQNVAYVMLTACERIAVAPLGSVVLTGPAAVPIHVKGLLDELGIKADFLNVGDYKGAAEPLTRDKPSSEMKETLGAILDGAYATMVDTIATSRSLKPDAVEGLIDDALFPAERAVAAKLADVVDTFDGFLDTASAAGNAEQGATTVLPWTTIRLEKKADPMAGMIKVAQFLGAMPTPRPLEPHIAVVYAVGSIVDGKGEGILGARQEIAARTLVPALRALAADDRVKAVVLRVDSGGGSALASELIWRAVSEVKAKKPVLVSMSDLAASGGYYISCGATRIYAQANTLTGSIGVVGGKLAPSKGLERIGVTSYPMGRGKRATMFADLSPWSDDERDAVRNTMVDVYDTFVKRVAAGRGRTSAQIKPVAQGRVWTGAKAKELGLVDEIGGLDAALAEARRLGGVGDDVALEIYPPAPMLRDFLITLGAVDAGPGPFAGLGLSPSLRPSTGPGAGTSLAADLTLRLAGELAPAAVASLQHTLRTLLTFRATPVQTVAFLPLLF